MKFFFGLKHLHWPGTPGMRGIAKEELESLRYRLKARSISSVTAALRSHEYLLA